LKDLAQFIRETFYGHQNDIGTTEFQVKNVLRFLIDGEMLENDGSNLNVTKFGSRVSQLYIDPLSAVILRKGLTAAETFDLPPTEIAVLQLIASTPDVRNLYLPPTEIAVLQLIASTPDVRNLYLRQKDLPELQKFLWEFTDEFLTEVPEDWDPKFDFFLMQLKTALLINDWISEKPEEAIITRFKTGSGDIVYLTARLLYNNGFKSIAALRKAEPRDLSRIPSLGPELARSIKEQVGSPVMDEELDLS